MLVTDKEENDLLCLYSLKLDMPNLLQRTRNTDTKDKNHHYVSLKLK